MSGYRYPGKPDLSQANRDIMAERSTLSETELAQRLGELDKHIREYPYMPVRPLTSEPGGYDDGRGSAKG